MVFRSVGTNLSRPYLDGAGGLAEDLGALKRAGADFLEIWPENLGVILGGSLDANRLRAVRELLSEAELAYTVHAPLEVNLMDLTSHGLQRPRSQPPVRREHRRRGGGLPRGPTSGGARRQAQHR